MHGNETALKKIVVFEILLSFANLPINLPGLFPKYMRVSPADVEIAHRILRTGFCGQILRTDFADSLSGVKRAFPSRPLLENWVPRTSVHHTGIPRDL